MDLGDAARPSDIKLTNRAWVLGLLMVVYIVNFVDRTILYLLQEPIKAEFGLADWQLGLLGGTSFGLFYALMGVPIGRLAERYKRTGIIAVAITSWSLATVGCGLVINYVQLLLARIGVAVGEAGSAPPAHSIITDYFPPDRRATALTLFAVGVPLGQLVGAALGGTLADNFGWRATFIIVGLPGIILSFFVYFTIKEPPRGYSEPDRLTNPANDSPPPPISAVLRRAVQQKAFLHVLAGSTVTAFAGYATTGFTGAFFLRNFNMSLSSAGAAYAMVFGVASAVGILAGGIGADALARRDPRYYGWMPAAALGLAAPLLIFGFSQSTWFAAMIALFVPGALIYMHIGSTYSIMHNSFPPRMRATITSFLFLAHALLGLSLGPLALGLLSDALAHYNFALGDFAAVCPGGRAITGATTALGGACQDASAKGLKGALMILATFYIWAATHYFMAARHLRRETVTVDQPLKI